MKPKHFGHRVSCRFCAESFRIGTNMVIPCPKCRHDLRVKPDYIGKGLRCKYCGDAFRVSGPADIGLPTAPGRRSTSHGRLGEVNEEAQRRLNALEVERERLSGELAEKTAAHSLSVGQLKHAQEQLDGVQQQFHEIERRRAEAAVSEKLANRLAQELTAANNRILDLQRQLQELELLRGRLDQAEKDRDQLGRSWQAEREQLCASFQEDHGVKLQEAEARWRGEIARLEAVHECLKRERDQAVEEARGFDRQAKMQELESLRAGLDQAERERVESEISWRVEHQKLLADAEERLQVELQQLEARLQAELARSRENCNAVMLERDQLKQEADASKAEGIDRITALEAGWRDESLRLEQAHDARLKELEDRRLAELAGLQNLVGLAHQERDLARARVTTLQQEIEEQLQNRDEERATLEEQWRAEARAQKELAERLHQEELARLRAELEERLGGGQESRMQVQAQLETLSAAHERLQKELVLLAAEYDAVKDQAAGHQQELDRFEQDREQVMQEWMSRMQNEHQVQFQLAEQRFEELRVRQEHEMEALRQELQAAQLSVGASQEEVESLKADRRGSLQSSKKMQTALIRFEEERQALQREVEHFREEADALRQWREGTRKEIEALWKERDALVACREEFDKHKKDIDELRQERDRAVEELERIRNGMASPAPKRWHLW